MTEGIPITLTPEQFAAIRDGAPLIVCDGNGGNPLSVDPRRNGGMSRKLIFALLGALIANAGAITVSSHRTLSRLDRASRGYGGFCDFQQPQRLTLDAGASRWYAWSNERRWCAVSERLSCAGSPNALHTDSMGESNC